MLISQPFNLYRIDRKTYNRAHEWKLTVKFREDMLDHELLHVRAHLWVLHHEVTERGRHVERAELLRRVSGARVEHRVDELEDGHEGRFSARASEREEERGCGGNGRGKIFVFI